MRRSLLVIAAVLLAAVGTTLVYLYAKSADDRARAGQDSITVLVVRSTRIEANTPATSVAGQVEPRSIPRTAAATGAINSVEELRQLATQVLQVPVLAGSQLTTAMFGDQVTTGAAAGMSLISITMAPADHLGKLLKEGIAVDIFERDQGGHATSLLSRVRVFAIDGDLITFEVGRADVLRLADAQGKIFLTTSS